MIKVTALMMAVLLILPQTGWAKKEKEKWEKFRARHFYIYHKNAPAGFVENVEKAAEQLYEEITRDLGFTRYEGWSFDRRAQIYIYSDQEDYVTSANQAGWSHGVANAREKVIRTFPSAHGFFDSTLPHELGHIIFREFVGFRSPLPLWLDEGVAMYQEKAKRWGSNGIVKDAMDSGQFIDLDRLSVMRLSSSTDKETVNLFYAEAASVVYYMIAELGEQRFVKFCRQLKSGLPFIQALRAAYARFDTVEDLNRAWVSYLEDQ